MRSYNINVSGVKTLPRVALAAELTADRPGTIISKTPAEQANCDKRRLKARLNAHSRKANTRKP
jgi:hypothetical protein